MASDIVITPNRGSTSVNAKIDFTGASTASSQIRLEVLPDNSLSFVGTTGSLFSIADSVTGSLMSVNDASGLPILEVFDTDKVVMGQYNQNTLVVNGTKVGIGTASPTDKLTIAGVNSNGITFTGSNATLTSNTNLIGVAGTNIYLRPGSGYTVTVDTGNGLYVTSGESRALLFRDAVDTAYYVDPGSTSNLNGLTVAGTITGSISGNAATASSAAAITGGMPNGTDYYINLRVIRNNNTGGSNDGMYIGYGNSNSAITRLYGGGSTTNHAYVDVNGDIWRSSGGYQYVYNSGTWSGISIGGNAATATTATTWQTARNFTIGSTARSVNGSSDYSWTVADIGAAVGLPAYQAWSFDSVKTPGLYQYDGAIGATKPPDGSANYRTIEVGSSTRYSQIALPWDSDNMYFRRQTNSTWSTWRTVLTDGNYNSYAPTLTGTGASGTWGISITGNAATATSADQIDGVAFRNTGSNAGTAADSLEQNGITYVNSNISLLGQSDGALFSQAYNSNWQHQIYGDYRTGQIVVRGKNNGTWQSWRTVLDSSNYTSYVGNGTLTLNTNSGSGLSGSASFTANQSGNVTFTVTSNATASNTANTIVLRDGSGNIFGQEIYASGWFRNYGYQGIYNQDYATHFYAGGTGYYNLAGNGSATDGGLTFRSGHQSTIKGRVYWDSAGFGLLNDSGNWAVRSNYGSQWSGGSIYGAWLKTSANNTGGITVPGVFIQSGVTSGTPTAIQSGDLWWNTDTGKLKIYWSSASAWVDATPVPDMAGYYTTGGGNINGNVNVNGLLESTGNINARVGQTHSLSLGTHPSYGASWVGLWRTGSDYALITNSNNTLLNAPTGSIGFRVANSEYAYVNSSGVTTNGSFIMSGGFTLSQNGAYGQTNNWIHLNGYHGLYSGNNSAHIYPNNNSSYGSWGINGSRNSYGGIYDAYSGVAWMHDSGGNGGLYKEANSRWYIYYNHSTNNCLGIGSSATTSGYVMQVNGNSYVTGYERVGGGNLYIDGNYGRGVVGLYASTRYQGVFAMGDSYKLADDGTTTGTLYGIAWSHPNAGGVAANLNTHGALVMENGTFLAAISGSIRCRDDMRAPRFYDSGDTNYYCDPASTSVFSGLTIGGNTALHAGNYNSYAPTLTGGGASGVWSINVTGSAGLVSWVNVSARPTWMTATNLIETLTNFNNSRPSGFYQGSSATNAPTAGTWYNLINVRHDNVNNDHGFQLAMSYYSNVLYHRHYQSGTGQNDGTFSAWATVLSDQNYTSYVGNGTLTLNVSGTGLSGSTSFTANQSGNTTFTVTSNATSANTASAIVARDSNGDFQARNITTQDDYTNGWFRNNSNNTGLYNQSTYLHLSSSGANTSYLDISTVGSTNSGIRFYTGGHVNTLRGYIVANTSNELMLWNAGGSYSARFTSTQSEIYQDTYVPTLYANIMYRRGDTGYYLDPAATESGKMKYSFTVSAQGSSAGYGLALYPSYTNANGTSTEPTYGVMFASTSTYGAHGGVAGGDWATYFTMNNSDSRGWIFRKAATGNVASINGAGRMRITSLGVNTDPSTTAGEIRATDNITAYYSDERLKTKLGAIENPIEKVKSLSGFYFEANETAVALGYQKKREVGVSAQEVQAILPEIIAPAPIDDKYMTVRYEKLIPLLIEAIKAQQAQIEELQKLIKEKV